jgi:predicted tellurium resistance membrane protein TerC
MFDIVITTDALLSLFTLTALEIVLGIDNIVIIAIISNALPAHQRDRARVIGLALALITRLLLLFSLAWLASLTKPMFHILAQPFSGRDLIMLAGGLFLLVKATKEIHHSVDPAPTHDVMDAKNAVINNAGAAIVQIILLDLVFSVDSILTAVGMTDHVPVMMIAVIFAVLVMLLASDPLAHFIEKNPTVVMLALGFLLMIGTVLIADGFGVHVPKGYIYAAMAFSALVEGLNMLARSAKKTSADKSKLH